MRFNFIKNIFIFGIVFHFCFSQQKLINEITFSGNDFLTEPELIKWLPINETSLFNKYTPGSGVGGLNASVRRNKYRRASAVNLTMAQLEADYKARQNGTPITYPKIPCCPSMTSNPSNLAYPYLQQ